MTTIDKSQIQWIQKRKKDDVGRVFESEDRIYRAIYREHVPFVKEIFECGLLNELMEKNLFPQSSVTNLKLEGFALVIEHEKIFPIVLPNEWSFSMLKDAALLTIK